MLYMNLKNTSHRVPETDLNPVKMLFFTKCLSVTDLLFHNLHADTQRCTAAFDLFIEVKCSLLL